MCFKSNNNPNEKHLVAALFSCIVTSVKRPLEQHLVNHCTQKYITLTQTADIFLEPTAPAGWETGLIS